MIIPFLCAIVACDTDDSGAHRLDDEIAIHSDLVVENEQDSEYAEAVGEEVEVEVDVQGENRDGTCQANCLAQNFAFCFWTGTSCTGYRIAIPGGNEFDFTFSNDLRSMQKRTGTVKVALYDKFGKCLQSIPAGAGSHKNLAHNIRRAKWNAACP